jgi:hypothetical protein
MTLTASYKFVDNILEEVKVVIDNTSLNKFKDFGEEQQVNKLLNLLGTDNDNYVIKTVKNSVIYSRSIKWKY